MKRGLQQVTKQPYQGKDTLVFECMDRFFERSLIEAAATMDLEIPLLLQALAAEVPRSISEGFGESAARAVWGLNRFNCRTARRAHEEVSPLPIEEGLTDRACRGKDEVQQPPKGSGWPHLKIPVHNLRGMRHKRHLDLLLGAGGKGTPLIATRTEREPVLDLSLAVGATIGDIGPSFKL